MLTLQARYLHDDDEVKAKTLIWNELNKEYIQQQEEKEREEAANIAAGKPSVPVLSCCSATWTNCFNRRRSGGEIQRKIPLQQIILQMQLWRF